MTKDSTERFGDRATAYALARPSYPVEMFAFFEHELDLGPGQRAADLGSGTGILTELLLKRGLAVDAVEPNEAMRAEAERRLAGYAGFRSVDGTAESTGLERSSADWVMAAQAFHWFDAGRAAAEIRRVLKPGGVCALIWNRRLTGETPFLRAYEAFLDEWGTDYAAVKETYESLDAIAAVLGADYNQVSFPNTQTLDFEGLKARLLSVSYVPAADDPRAKGMLAALGKLFEAHAAGDTVRIEYRTQVYYARVPA